MSEQLIQRMRTLLVATMRAMNKPRVELSASIIEKGEEAFVLPEETIAAMLAARNEALEEAALMAESFTLYPNENAGKIAADKISRDIRALKEST